MMRRCVLVDVVGANRGDVRRGRRAWVIQWMTLRAQRSMLPEAPIR